MAGEPVVLRVQDASAFDGTSFLGLARRSKRDPYRLGLFAQHLEADERPRVLLAIHGGTLVVTDRRILEFRAHLEVHGAWNVKEFQGYEVRRDLPRQLVLNVDHVVSPAPSAANGVEDVLRLTLAHRDEAILVSRGPEATLSTEDFDVLRAAVLDHAK